MNEVERREYEDRSNFMGEKEFMDLNVYEIIDKN